MLQIEEVICGGLVRIHERMLISKRGKQQCVLVQVDSDEEWVCFPG